MKTSPSRRNDGFTLVELLVVIAIIAVLAGAGFAAGTAAVNKAKRVKCLATATGLESAVNQFYSEYNYPPVATPNESKPVDTTSDVEFLNAMLGYTEAAATPLNPKAIKFLNAKEGNKLTKKDGLVVSGSGASTKAVGLYDPWGGAYFVLLDDNYDEVIIPKVSAAGGASPTLNGRKAAVWSNGADGVNGGGTVGDDVITWTK